jgi:hypothetical protein
MDKLADAVKRAPTEFEVQADCYQLLKQHFPVVRGEIKIQFDRENKYERRPRGARYDLVVCDIDYKPLFVVEVKRKERETHSKAAHYERLSGVKCYTVGSLNQCKQLIERII